MHINWKYFFLLPFLGSCMGSIQKDIESDLPLFLQPVTVPLNVSGGYTINGLTGDSIKPFITAGGDTIKTGIPVPLIAKEFNEEETIKPKIIQGVQTIKTIIPDNVHPIPEKLSIINVDTAGLKKVKLGEGDQSFVLRNTYGVVPTGVPIPVTGKKISFSEPPPVKATPMRFKDNATTSIQYLDVEQGLGYSYVTAVCEDKKGNLWFGIDGMGISKYDGINITTYSVKEGLTHTIVSSIMEGGDNKLWIGTNGGVTCYDGKNFMQYTEKDGLPSNKVLSILEDKKGNFWFSTGAGLTRYDGKSFTNYTRKEGLLSDTVYKCIEDRNGNIWIGTYKGAVKFDGNIFTHYTPKDGLAGPIASTLLEDKSGNIWIGSGREGLSMFDGKSFTRFTKKEGLSDNNIWSLQKDRNNNIWISTLGSGLNKYDGNNFTHYSIEQGLSNIQVRGMTEDRSGNLWLATEGGGVNKIIATSFSYPVPEELVENNRIRPILKDKNGNLWFGTENAHIGKLNAENTDGKGKIFTYYRLHDKLLWKGQRSLLQDKNGNIWIGTTGSGIIKYDGKIFTNYSLDTGTARQAIFDMLEDKQGNIWFGQNDGSITSYDGKNFIHYTTKQGLPGSIIYSMLEDKKGNIWFCTEGAGVYKYDGANLINYTEKEGLFSKSVTSIEEDEKGNIWLGTLGSGVCKFDGRSFIYYTEQQGLSNNNVWSVFQDSAKQLWVGTDKGLSLFIPQKHSPEELSQRTLSEKTKYAIYTFGLKDGLKAIDFNLHSVSVDNKNHLWWGTGKSIVSLDLSKGFHPDSLRSLSLNYIEINDRFYDFRNLPDSMSNNISFTSLPAFSNSPAGLKLTHDKDHLAFHFSAIDWSSPHNINYSYQLMGWEERWSKPSDIAVAEFRNLSYGRYVLQIKAIGQSQVWSKPFVYSFEILPPWWLTWWFKTIFVLVVLGALFFITRYIYINQLHKQSAVLEKQIAVQYERQRISAEMHDDIGASLSGVKLLTEISKTKIRDADAANEMEKIYQSVGDISAKMKEVIWSLNADNDDISSLISFIQKQTGKYLENYPCELTIDLPEQYPDIDISGEARRNIFLSVKEALHNIIKHSGADKINLSVTCSDKLVIIVSDNGNSFLVSGIDNSGNGLKNMRKRMEKLGGNFILKTGDGTKIIFEVPLKSII